MCLGLLYVLPGEVSVQVLCPFFNWIVCLPGVDHGQSQRGLGLSMGGGGEWGRGKWWEENGDNRT